MPPKRKRASSSNKDGKNTKRKRTVQTASRERELKLYADGVSYVLHVDEVGRGALAGPVVVCACAIPANAPLVQGVRDSKRVTTERARQKLADAIKAIPGIQYVVAKSEVSTIDSINIRQATHKAMEQAVAELSQRLGDAAHQYVLVDGDAVPEGIRRSHPKRCMSLIEGDANVYGIAAAALLAKVDRDAMMHEYHKQYPVFGFGQSKGYGTAAHMAALKKHGPCPLHRLSCRPCREAALAHASVKS